MTAAGAGRRPETQRSVGEAMRSLGLAARDAARVLAAASAEDRNAALRAAAAELRRATATIVEANERDLAAAKAAGRPGSFVDRLMFDPKRIEGLTEDEQAKLHAAAHYGY